MRKYLFLKKGVYFCQGPKRSAIYDLQKGIVYSLDENLSSVLKQCLLGEAFPVAISTVKQKADIIEKTIRELPFVSFSSRFIPSSPLETVLTKGVNGPSGVWLDLTEACNLRCIHCYAKAGKPAKGELSFKEWQRVIDELLSINYQAFTLGGGEPFFCPHILPLIEYLFKRGDTIVVILTNGTLLTDKVLDFLRNYPVSLNITFFSYKREHHERISAVKGSWQRTISGIKGVIKRNISYTINIPLGAYNQKDLAKTLDFLKGIGVEEGKAGGNIVYPLGRGCDTSVLPDPYTVFSVKKPIYQIPKTWEGKLIYQSCWAGKLLIKATGEVTPCPSAREEQFIVGNVKEEPLEKIVKKEKLQKLWNITLDDVDVCRACEFRYGCHDCRSIAYIYTNNLKAKNPYCLYDPYEGKWRSIAGEERELEGWYVKKEGLETRWIEGELAILEEDGSRVHLLNPIAAEIYNLCDGRHDFKQIVSILFEKYKVEKGVLEGDAARTIRELENLGIIQCQKGY